MNRMMTRSIGAAAMACMMALGFGAAQAGPFDDRIEAVLVKADVLPAAILGGDLGSYRVLVSDGGALKTIPMQIDECDQDGAVLLKEGAFAQKGDGKLNGKDELVFMAVDAGPDPGAAAVEGCANAATLEVADKKTGAKGYVVVAKCENPPAPSSDSYVKFDYKARRITTDRYRLGYEKKYAFYYDYMAVGKGPDILDRLKIRVTVGKLGISYTFNEDEHFEYSLLGYATGPVRTVTRSNNKLKLGPFGLIAIPQTINFYKNHVELLTLMDTTLNPAVLGLDFSVAIGHDMLLDVKRDYKVCINQLPQCRDFKNKISQEEVDELTAKDTVWGGFEGTEGALISYFIPDKRLPTRTLGQFVDNLEVEAPPEAFKGSSPQISFNVVEWTDAEPGTYALDFYHLFTPKYSVKQIDQNMRLVKQPLVVSAK